jgi:hypothetical protein
MNDKPAPQYLREYVEEMVEVGVQLATMLDHMYRTQLLTPGASEAPPPEVLRDLVAKTLQHRFRTSKREIQRATTLLRLSSRTIADEIILVEPGAFDDELQEELDLAIELPDLYGPNGEFPLEPDGDASNGNHLH